MAIESRPQAGSTPVDPGPFLAKVVSHLDPTYMGGLEVQLLREVTGDINSDGQLTTVKYLNPFYGVTGAEHVTDTDDFQNTQKSYGMWFVPPDVGTLVVVIFIGGDPRKGYWIGCVQDEGMNFMVPGLAATEFVVGDTKTG
jgi:phage gp45-like